MLLGPAPLLRGKKIELGSVDKRWTSAVDRCMLEGASIYIDSLSGS